MENNTHEEMLLSNSVKNNILIGLVPTLLITLLIAIYHFAIDAFNSLYWYLHNKSSLGFNSSPIDTALLKLIIVLYFILITGYLYANYLQRKKINITFINASSVFSILIIIFAVYLISNISIFLNNFDQLNEVILNKDRSTLLQLLIFNKKGLLAIASYILLMIILIFIAIPILVIIIKLPVEKIKKILIKILKNKIINNLIFIIKKTLNSALKTLKVTFKFIKKININCYFSNYHIEKTEHYIKTCNNKSARKQKTPDQSNQELFLIYSVLSLALLGMCIPSIYIIHNVLSQHQYIAQNKTSEQYIQIITTSNPIYPLYCENEKCFGYELINPGEGENYDVIYKTYQFSDII